MAYGIFFSATAIGIGVVLAIVGALVLTLKKGINGNGSKTISKKERR